MKKFYEQFITKDYGTLPSAINIISKAILLVTLFLFFSFGLILAIPFLIVFIILELYIANAFVEYEYEYYEKDLTISKIICKKKRKTIDVIKTNNILKVSQVNNVSKDEKVIRCTIKGLNLKEVVVFINNKNNKKVGYLLGLDDETLAILKRDNPSLFNYI